MLQPLLRLDWSCTEKKYTARAGGGRADPDSRRGVAFSVYRGMSVPVEPPFFARTVHPSPPADHRRSTSRTRSTWHRRRQPATVCSKHSDPEAFRRPRRAPAARSYYENCFYCHGDDMGGQRRPFAYGLNPIPTNFTDPKGVLDNFRETFFFWRISKGGPGHSGRGRDAGRFRDAGNWETVSDRAGDVGGRAVPLRLQPRIQAAGPSRNTALMRALAMDRSPTLSRSRQPRPRSQTDLGTEEQRAGGKKLYDKILLAVSRPRTVTARVWRPPYVQAKAARLHVGQVQDPDDAERRAPDAPDDLKEHHPSRGCRTRPCPRGRIFTKTRSWTTLVYYLKTFSEDFCRPRVRARSPINDSRATWRSRPRSRLSKGRGSLRARSGCIRVPRRPSARGDGLSAPTLQRRSGATISRSADLTKRWTFRGGPTRKDIFRAFSTGFNGTPMPSYAESLDEDQRWHLVNYITSLGQGDDPDYDTMVTATRVAGTIDLERGAEMFENSPPAYFPVVGQIMQPGREFWPSINGIEVRAVYNDSDVAIELRWHDMRTETDGVNGPDLEVPVFAEDPHRGGGAGGSDGAGDDEGGFWGDEVEEDEGSVWGDEEVEEGEEDFWGEEEAGDDFWGEEEGAGGALSPDREFSDAVAIQFPQQLPGGIRKPYFIFGDPQNPVDLWFFDLGAERPEQFVGRGSELLESQGVADLQAQATYDRGEWTVTFTRPLRSAGGIPLDEGLFVPVAFSVWDGFNRERGNKRGLTQWVYFYLEPGGKVSPVGPMMKAAGLAVMLELLVVVFLRRKYAGGATTAATPDMGHVANGTGPA